MVRPEPAKLLSPVQIWVAPPTTIVRPYMENWQSWSNAPDLKSGEGSNLPRVRISGSPPLHLLTPLLTTLTEIFNKLNLCRFFLLLAGLLYRIIVLFDNFGRRFTVYISSMFFIILYALVPSLCSTVITTLPLACPSAKYFKASGTLLSAKLLSITGTTFPD